VGFGLPAAIGVLTHAASPWMLVALLSLPVALYLLAFGLSLRPKNPGAAARDLRALPVGGIAARGDGAVCSIAGRIVPGDGGTFDAPLTKGAFVWLEATTYVYSKGQKEPAKRSKMTNRSVPFFIEADDGERVLVTPDEDCILRSPRHQHEQYDGGPGDDAVRAAAAPGVVIGDDERLSVNERGFRSGDRVFAIGLARKAAPYRGDETPHLEAGPEDALVVTGETRAELIAWFDDSTTSRIVAGTVLLVIAVGMMIASVLAR